MQNVMRHANISYATSSRGVCYSELSIALVKGVVVVLLRKELEAQSAIPGTKLKIKMRTASLSAAGAPTADSATTSIPPIVRWLLLIMWEVGLRKLGYSLLCCRVLLCAFGGVVYQAPGYPDAGVLNTRGSDGATRRVMKYPIPSFGYPGNSYPGESPTAVCHH